MKSELQEFMELAYKTQTGQKVELTVTEQIKQEMKILSDLGDGVVAIGFQRFWDMVKKAKKNG